MEVINLCVTAGTFRLTNVSFSIPTGGHAILMGPSGTGKTTTMEALCGLRRVDFGRIVIAGRDVARLSPADRNIGFVPQDGALFPHLTVRENIGFSLTIRRQSTVPLSHRIAELALQFGLENLLRRRVTDLSGGEKQRVALARAVAFRPSVLLLDEPFSALDVAARDILRRHINHLREDEGITILQVSHDPADARDPATQRIALP